MAFTKPTLEKPEMKDKYFETHREVEVFINATIGEQTTDLKVSNNLCCKQDLNDLRRINKRLEHLNEVLKEDDYLVVSFESQSIRKELLFLKYNKILAYTFHYLIDFLFHRVLARLSITKGIYFDLTKGKNRVVSFVEGLGRLISCGFDIVDHKRIDNKIYVISRKTRSPLYDTSVSYGLLITLNRIGKHAKKYQYYKFRTMHPYSEHLQKYVYEQNGTTNGYKLDNDFRVTGWGAFIRKYWIDELPMLSHLVKGELKIVGIRPLSPQKFHTLPKHLQELRAKATPGLIPPYYYDVPETKEEYNSSEERYLLDYLSKPLETDLRYFYRSVINILFKGIRSQ